MCLIKHKLQTSESHLHAMEIQSLFLLITSFLLFLLLRLAKNHRQKSFVRKLPPGPWKLPIVGNLHQLARAGSIPHRALRELAQKYGPLMHLQLGEISAVIVSCPDMAKEIMKTHDIAFAQRPEFLSSKIMVYGSADIAFAPYGHFWRQMRKICMLELLSVKRGQSFSYIREEEVAKLIESIQSSASGSPINLTQRIVSLTSTFVCRSAFGNKSKDQDEFLSLMKKSIELGDGFDLADLFPSIKPIHLITGLEAKLQKMHKKLDKMLENIINDNQEKKMKAAKDGKGEPKEENLVDVLLRIQQSGGLEIPVTMNNVKAVIWDIFSAGTDTSSTTVEWAMAELMRNPRVRNKAQAEIRQAFKGKEAIRETDLEGLTYFKSVIKETLRLHPPLPLLLPRECREECKIGGYEIPIKTKIIINAWAIGRDSEHWHEAEKFIPERFEGDCFDFKGTKFEYIPFGAGRRMCPGISFGLANMELALARLLYHFNWELPDGTKAEDLDMTEASGVVVGRKNNLYLIQSPYNPSLDDSVIVN